ncbi:MAG: S8 family serine peptidase [Microscillaceae bacterium]|nr:S8 family serine peptidase [Microscillaceae bacterium]
MKRFIIGFFCLLNLAYSLSAQSQQLFQFPKGFSKDNYLAHTIVYKLKAQEIIAKSAKQASPKSRINPLLLNQLGVKNVRPLFDADNFIFNYKKADKIGEKTKKLALIYFLDIDPTIDLEQAINLLRNDPAVEYAEPVYTNYAPQITLNDPLAATSQQYHLTQIKAFEAWDIQRGSPTMKIGIIDNGCTVTNNDLNANYQAPVFINSSTDLLNDLSGATTNNIFDADNNVTGGSHGQSVALCAAAVPNNNVGTAGTGFSCKFLPVKVAPTDNLNNYIDGYAGVLYAAKQGCQVINMSWGRKGFPSDFDLDVLRTVYEEDDVVLIAAAGNDNNQEFFYPASYEMVLSVAATDASDIKSSFSTYNREVDLSAPGTEIKLDNSAAVSGTSFAAPLVAGAAALLRVQYPDWNAAQIMARLKTTTDDLYGQAVNQTFRGKLGAGRLNMLKALTAPLKAITLDSCLLSPTNAEGFLVNGSNVNLILYLQNHFNELSDLKVTIRSESPFITIIDSISQIGAVAASTPTMTDNFLFSIDENTPANTIARFFIIYQDLDYSYTEEYEILLNPGHVSNNLMEFSVSNHGEIAVYDNSFEPLTGLSFKNHRLLSEAGLMIGIQDASGNFKVSDAVRFDANAKNQDFTVIDALQKNTSGTLESSVCRFEDITNNSERIGIEVTQRTYSWNETGLDKALVLEYQIRNLSSGATLIDKPYVGLFANWNINNSIENSSRWDADNLMAYAYDTNPGGLLGGIVLLTDRPDRLYREPSVVNYYTFDPANFDVSANIFDGFTTAEKFKALSSGLLKTQSGTSGKGNDVYQILGSRFDKIDIGQTRSMAFAFVVGQDLNDLKNSAIQIKNKFRNVKTSPLPVVQDILVCKNEDAVIIPSNGSLFNFYVNPPDNQSITPIFTGSSFNISHITNDQTYYVTSIDSLFESDYVTVNVEVSEVNASFEPDQSRLDLSLNTSLNLQNTSEQVVSFLWEIRRGLGLPNADVSFINGTQANSPSPQISFSQPGDYTIKLVGSNQQNCVDSSIIDFEVVQSITTGISEFLKNNLRLSPNPAEEFIQIALPDFQKDIRIEIINTRGQKMKEVRFGSRYNLSEKISLSALPSGVYYLKAYLGQDFYTWKFIKI